MKAIILAAGRGSRMGAATDLRPKCLAELGGRPLLDWQVGALRQAGVDEIGIVRGYRGDLLENRGADRLFDNPRWSQTNMVRSLVAAAEWLSVAPCVVSYSDIVYQPSAVRSLASTPAWLAITYDPNWLHLWSRRFPDPLADAETFRLAADGTVLEIGNRPRSVAEVEGQYMGLLKFTPDAWAEVERLLDELPAAEADRLDMTSLLGRLIARGKPITAVPYVGSWGEADNQADLALYERMLGSGEMRLQRMEHGPV